MKSFLSRMNERNNINNNNNNSNSNDQHSPSNNTNAPCHCNNCNASPIIRDHSTIPKSLKNNNDNTSNSNTNNNKSSVTTTATTITTAKKTPSYNKDLWASIPLEVGALICSYLNLSDMNLLTNDPLFAKFLQRAGLTERKVGNDCFNRRVYSRVE